MGDNSQIILFDGFTLDLARGCVRRSGQPVHLRPLSYDVLKYLAENRGHLISKNKLIEEVWRGRAVTDGSLAKCIEDLRDALGPEARNLIRNVRGRGYIFDTEDREVGEGKAFTTPEGQLEVLRVTVEDDEEPPDLMQPRGRRTVFAARPSDHKIRNLALATATALLLVVAVFVGYRVLISPAANGAPITSIAVLPFTNESGNPELEYLSDGMTESLINSLSQLPQLSVKARSSVFQYKGKSTDVQRIASEFSVQAIVEGRLVQHGDDLTLYLALVDGRNGNQIWGDQYNRKLKDLVSLQSEIARDVSHKLRVRLSGTEEQNLAKNYTENTDAYQLYLRGRYHFLRLTTPEIKVSISQFQQAIDLDPSYALAYVGLAGAYRALAIGAELSPSEFLPKAKQTAQKAIEIDDNLAEAHAELAFIMLWYDWDWTAVENQCKRALELDPKSAEAHLNYAHILSNTGRHSEALAEAKRARELDPLNVRTAALEGEFLIHAGRTDEALAGLQKIFELEPNYWFAHMFAASAYIEKGMLSEAITEALKAKELSGASAHPEAFLGYALAQAGQRPAARAVLNELLKSSDEHYVRSYHIALIYNGLGEHDATLTWLERGFKERDPKMALLNAEPKWNNLRNDAHFQDLLRRMGFTTSN